MAEYNKSGKAGDGPATTVAVRAADDDEAGSLHRSSSSGVADVTGTGVDVIAAAAAATTTTPRGTTTTTMAAATAGDAVNEGLEELEATKMRWYSYLGTADFWAALAVGQVLALCITATNTFSSLLSSPRLHTSIPAFQTLFNYVLLTLAYLPYTVRRHGGPRGWLLGVVRRDGWKYLALSFLDVEGNYLTVLAYRYTNLLSAQLINFWAIVCVVALSFALLRVRYRPAQVAGILIACGGTGVLLASDHLQGTNGWAPDDAVRGDLLALAGATMYGAANVGEEWFVSRRPAWEVLSFLGLWGVLVNGATAAIFDRDSFRGATWSPEVAGYLVGYTLCLFLFYSAVPVLLRMASAAFLNISLLTASFWGAVVGVRVLGLTVHFLYPVAFVCIVLGLATYFLAARDPLAESRKPWLGPGQEGGVEGLGTAKRRAKKVAERRRREREEGGEERGEGLRDGIV